MNTKLCLRCQETKPLTDFTRNRNSKDGHWRYCRLCKRAMDSTPEALANHNRRRRRQYATDEEHRGRYLERNRVYFAAHADKLKTIRAVYWQKYKAENRDKLRARGAVRSAVKRGKIPHPSTLSCHKCGALACDYHHHLGYARENRLDVLPVCHACHCFEHRK